MTADHVLLDLLPGALEGRADALALLDIFDVQPKTSTILPQRV